MICFPFEVNVMQKNMAKLYIYIGSNLRDVKKKKKKKKKKRRSKSLIDLPEIMNRYGDLQNSV